MSRRRGVGGCEWQARVIHSVCLSFISFCIACARLCFCPEDMGLFPKRCDSRDHVVAFALSAADACGLERCSSLTVLVCYGDVAALHIPLRGDFRVTPFVIILSHVFWRGLFVSQVSGYCGGRPLQQ